MASAPNPASFPRRDLALDGLRGLAVLMVFVFHYGGGLKSTYLPVRLLGYVTQMGWTGVILFFTLSGFLITGSLWDSFSQPHWLRNFYARRALRIFPLYYAVLLAVLVYSIGLGARFSEMRPLALYALFLQDLPILADRATAAFIPLPLYHLWSLAVEEQFYLLWPALLFVLYRGKSARLRRALVACLALFVLAEAFRLLVYGFAGHRGTASPHLFDSFLLTHAGALALGAGLALALRAGRHPAAGADQLSPWDQVQRAAPASFLMGVALYAVSSWSCSSFVLAQPLQYTLGLPAVSLAGAALIPLAMRTGLPRTLLAFAPLAWLGRISYGFYVFHVLLQPLFDALGAHLSHATSGTAYQTGRFVVALPISILVAWLSFYFFETPFLQRKRAYPMPETLPSD